MVEKKPILLGYLDTHGYMQENRYLLVYIHLPYIEKRYNSDLLPNVPPEDES
jgi:hypothetical protein